MILIVMGVSGSGKSTVAAAMNASLHWAYQEGDALHPPANVDKMQAGSPLTDADRAPWLAAVRGWIDTQLATGLPGMITCSALKRSYRDALVGGRAQVRLLYLEADRAILEDRLARRTGHFMPPSLLDSQLSTLEPPQADERPIVVAVAGTLDHTVRAALAAISAAD